MSDQVLQERARGPAGFAPAGQPGDFADRMGRLVGETRGRRRVCCAHHRQPSVGRFDRQGRSRGHDVRGRAHPRQADHRGRRRTDLGRHRIGLRRIAHPPHHGPAGRRRRRPQHRGHGAQRGRAAAVVQRARRTRRRTSQGGRRRGRARGDQRPNRPVPSARTATNPTASTVRSRG